MAAVGEPAAGSYMVLVLIFWYVCMYIWCCMYYVLAHTGGIGICCEEGRGGRREACLSARCLNGLCEPSNPVDLSISLTGGEETN